MSALEQLIRNMTENRKPSRKRGRDEMVYKEVYNISKCQNTKMRSVIIKRRIEFFRGDV